MEIKKDIHYVGVNDRTTALFENLWPLPYGVSYNAYLINDEKVALIDTVEASRFSTFLANIRRIIGERPIDYLVVNHMEPDHSGSIALLKQYYPNLTVVGNKKTFEMCEGYYALTGERLTVAEGDTLTLGQHTLQFAMIPMVHWPETMVTYDATAKALFSGDAFGCFGALNGGVVDKDIDTHIYHEEMVRYYANIVGKYGAPVQKALKKVATLEVETLCPTHGPVWQEEAEKVIATYDRLSRYEAEPGVVIAYGSMYGHTEEMAEAIAQALSQQGVKKIVLHDVSHSHHSYILADVFRYQGLILGCPTYNGQLYPETESLVSKLQSRDIKGRYLGWFGSFTWAGAAVKKLTELAEALKYEAVGEPVEVKQAMTEANREQCAALAQAMAEKIKG
jgi:flavorubredoxin